MEEFASNAPRHNGGTGPSGDAELEEIRNLLLGREKAQLARLQSFLDDPEEHALAVSRVLPEAVRLSLKAGNSLAHELAAPVETALRESVRRRPEVLTEVIFPVLGPAIRRAVSDAIGRFVQNLNAILERGFSLRSLKWRIEAWRTGRSYAEIVVYHTLIYRVEEVLLIQRPSGLLLHHVAAPGSRPMEPEVASAMLSAIQDFVADSLGAHERRELRTLEAGSLSVWIESGPLASLAAVIQGRPPGELHELLQCTLEKIHREYGERLASPDGLAGSAGEIENVLSECLTGEFRNPPPGSPYAKFAIGLVFIVLLAWLTIWVATLFQQHGRWAAYLDRLRAEEGIFVTSSDAHLGRFRITGLRDPLAADPNALLGQFRVPTNRVTHSWEHYQAMTPRIVLQRASQVLRPPEQISLQFTNGVLSAHGVASREWLTTARNRAEGLPGIIEFDTSNVTQAAPDIDGPLTRISSAVVHFEEATRLAPGQEKVLDAVAEDLERLAATVPAGSRLQLFITGHTDRTGPDQTNIRLSHERAQEVRWLLATRARSRFHVVVSGVGSSTPMRPEMTPSEEHLNRRVTFRAAIEPAGP